MNDVQMTILPNGLRVVTDRIPSIESVAVGVWAAVGSRHEKPEYNGVAHMVEHMMFKGTKKRNMRDIAEVIENVGGHMNAYTSREVTSYHVHLLREDMPLAMDVIGDMYQNSILPEDELIKERQVILQEIGMCRDTPDDLVFDNYYETAYANQAAGRPILGPAEIVAYMPREALAAHIKNNYTAANSVVVASGNVHHDEFVAQASVHFSLPASTTPAAPQEARYTGGERLENKDDLEQAHIILGFNAPSRHDDHYYDTRVLTTLLGGGMSSRLFQEIREKRGLVYTVYAFYQVMQDGGQLGFYAGTGAEKLTELMPVLCDEVLKAQNSITEAEINRTRAQLKASLLMGRESMMNRADGHAKSVLFYGDVFDPADAVTKIDAVNCESVMRAAHKIFKTAPTLAALGPIQSLESYDSLKKRL
jgi:predicted Zn-dependent peptidase